MNPSSYHAGRILADIEARHFYGATPLLSSIRGDRVDVTKFLVEKGANVHAADVLGRTPLITSAIEGHSDLATVMLEAGADIHVKDNHFKRAALHFAALYGHLNIVAELLKKGADPNEKDGTGKTPLDYASRSAEEFVAKIIEGLEPIESKSRSSAMKTKRLGRFGSRPKLLRA